MLKDILPAAWRFPMYLIFGLVGLGLTATQAGYSAAQLGQPIWLTVSFAVFGVLAAGFGLTAAGNINKPDDDAPKHLADD